MSARPSTRRLKRGERERAPRLVMFGAPTVLAEQPVDGPRVIAPELFSPVVRTVVAQRADANDVANGLEHHTNGAPRARVARGRKHGHGAGVQHRAGLGTNGLHIIATLDLDGAIAEVGMLVRENLGAIEGIGQEQRLRHPVHTPRQVAQRLQQLLETLRISGKPTGHARVGSDPVLEERRGRSDRGHSVADSVCQSTKQIVMNGKPARRADIGSDRGSDRGSGRSAPV